MSDTLAGAALFSRDRHDEHIKFEIRPIRTDMSTRKVLLISEDFPEPLCDYETISLAGTSLSVV